MRDFESSNLHLIKQDKWRGEDMELNLGRFNWMPNNWI